MTALPRADRGRLIDGAMESRWQAAWNAPAVSSLPWPVWKITPGAWPRGLPIAIASVP
jgi:hypothetical protein